MSRRPSRWRRSTSSTAGSTTSTTPATMPSTGPCSDSSGHVPQSRASCRPTWSSSISGTAPLDQRRSSLNLDEPRFDDTWLASRPPAPWLATGRASRTTWNGFEIRNSRSSIAMRLRTSGSAARRRSSGRRSCAGSRRTEAVTSRRLPATWTRWQRARRHYSSRLRERLEARDGSRLIRCWIRWIRPGLRQPNTFEPGATAKPGSRSARPDVALVRGVTGQRSWPLTGWTLASVPPGHVEHPKDLDAANLIWVPATVPGTVSRALTSAGRRETHSASRFDDLDWWFRCDFPRPTGYEGTVALRLDGLATLAHVWLNDTHILASENMFLTHEVDVRGVLGEANTLAIRFQALDEALGA